MDDTRFDAIARALGAGITRRDGLRAWLGGLAGAGLAAATWTGAAAGPDATGKKKKKKKCKPACQDGLRCVKGACACREGDRCADVCAVGCPYTDVAAAVSAAEPGATILVGAGVYPANLTIDKDLTLEAFPGATVTLDGGRLGPVVSVTAGTVAIGGLAIRNGAGVAQPDQDGGCVHVEDGASLALEGVEISGCEAAGRGGGIAALGDLVVRDSFLRDCTAADGGGISAGEGRTATLSGVDLRDCAASGFGGGIIAFGTLDVEDSTIADCRGGRGSGGIEVRQTGRLAMRRSVVSGCVAESADETARGFGGGLTLFAAAEIADSTFRDNRAVGGGAIMVQRRGPVALTDCVVEDNAASDAGGGIATFGDLRLERTVVRGCTAARAAGGIVVTGGATGNPPDNGSLEMIGGEISGCRLDGAPGQLSAAGLAAYRPLGTSEPIVRALLRGVAIVGNTATGSDAAGGIMIGNATVLTLEGDTVVSGNAAEGPAPAGLLLARNGAAVCPAGAPRVCGNPVAGPYANCGGNAMGEGCGSVCAAGAC